MMSPHTAFPSGQLLQVRAASVMPGGVNSATRYIGAPYAFTRSAGQYVWDADGNRYTDYHAAFGAILLGHNDPHVNEAVREVLGELDLVGIGVTELETRLAETLTDIIPSAEQVVLCTSGSEAVALSVRLARAATGRRHVIKVQGGFHGWHDPVARNVISAPENAYEWDPLSAGILPDALQATLIAEFNDLGSAEKQFDAFPGQVAAVILEPIPHNVGALLPVDGYLQGLRDLATREGAVLIFDEIITGFRHAMGGFQEVCGVRPDLTTFGKAMGNGYPIAGLAGRSDLMTQFSPGGSVMLAGTFAGHPVGAAAALETIARLRTSDLHGRIFALGDRMRTGLRAIVSELGIRATVTGFGSVFVVYFLEGPARGYRDLLRNNDRAYYEFHRQMTDRGFLMLPLALKRNHISGSHTEQDVDLTLDAAREVLGQLRRSGILIR
jgi:glutamate-1-semialdehyde-2,1-aminomutase